MLWPDLQTFLIETIPHHGFDKKRCPTLITNFMIRSTEAAVHRCSSKQMFLKFLQFNIHKKIFILLFIISVICYHYAKHRLKQKIWAH